MWAELPSSPPRLLVHELGSFPASGRSGVLQAVNKTLSVSGRSSDGCHFLSIAAVCPQAYERRFPTCPLIPMFVDSDTVSEFKSEDGAIHVIERRCKLDIDAPRLLKKVLATDTVQAGGPMLTQSC